jgi:hypothetical protein
MTSALCLGAGNNRRTEKTTPFPLPKVCHALAVEPKTPRDSKAESYVACGSSRWLMSNPKGRRMNPRSVCRLCSSSLPSHARDPL